MRILSVLPPAQSLRLGFTALRQNRIARLIGFALVNLWLVFHLAGIVIAPWSVPPSSRLVQNSWGKIGPYVQLLFLNHGYHYFAPEPGSSTLVAYVLEMPEKLGEVQKEFQIHQEGSFIITVKNPKTTQVDRN